MATKAAKWWLVVATHTQGLMAVDNHLDNARGRGQVWLVVAMGRHPAQTKRCRKPPQVAFQSSTTMAMKVVAAQTNREVVAMVQTRVWRVAAK